MNLYVVIGITLRGTTQIEAITLESSMDYNLILQKSLRTFNISEDFINEYCLFIPSISCYVKSFEHLLGAHLIRLEKSSIKQDNIMNKTPKKSICKISSTSTFHQKQNEEGAYLEIVTTKEELESRFHSPPQDKNEEEKVEFKDMNDDVEQKNDEYKISLEELFDETFADRKELTMFVRGWAVSNSFQVILDTREQILKKDNTRITKLVCNQKGCEFFLEFRFNKDNEEKYKLNSYFSKHNHKLSVKNGSLEFISNIIEKLKEFRSVSDDTRAITDSLNKTFNKKFDISTTWYQLKKLKDMEYGYLTNDATNLVQLLEKDRSEKGIAFSKELDSNGNLTPFYFMTNRMKTLANKFSDILIIDASHKTNRFGQGCRTCTEMHRNLFAL